MEIFTGLTEGIRNLSINNFSITEFVMFRLSWILVLALIAIIVFLAVKSFPFLKKELAVKSKKTWVLLGLVLVVAMVIRFAIIPYQHLMYCDESYYSEAARNILLHGQNARCFYDLSSSSTQCESTKPTVGWNAFLVIPHAIFGTGDLVAIRTSAFFGVLGVLLAFILATLIFRNEIIGLFSALLLCFFPIHAIWSGTSEVNVFGIFLLFLMLISIFLYSKTSIKWTHWLGVAVFLLMIQVKFEYFIFIFSFIIIYFYNFYKKRSIEKSAKRSIKRNIPKQVGSTILPWLIGLPFLVCFVFECAMSFMGTNATYSISLFIENFLLEANEAWTGGYFPFLFFALGSLGIIWALFKRRQKELRAHTLSILIPVLLVITVYISFPYAQQSRYFMITHWIFLVYALFFLWEASWIIGSYLVKLKPVRKLIISVQRKKTRARLRLQRLQISQLLNNKETTIKTVLCTLVILLILSSPVYTMAQKILDYRIWPASYLATRASKSLDNDFDRDCFIVTQHEEADIIGASVHQRLILTEGIYDNRGRGGIESINALINSSACVLYYKGLICTRNYHSPTLFGENEKKVCGFADENFELEKLKDYNLTTEHQNLTFTVYRLNLVNYPDNSTVKNSTMNKK